MKSALQIILRTAIILAAAAVVSYGGQVLIHSTFGQSLTGMPSGGQGFQPGGAPAGEQAEVQSSDQSAGSASASTGQTSGQGMQRGGRGGHGGGNAILELVKNLAIVLVLTAIGGLITTMAQRFLRKKGKPALAGVDD